MNISGFPSVPVPPQLGNWTELNLYLRRLTDALRLIGQGKTQNTGQVTLKTGQATTSVSDIRVSSQSAIAFAPRTASAAAELYGGSMYILDPNLSKGSFTITHSSSVIADRTFSYIVTG